MKCDVENLLEVTDDISRIDRAIQYREHQKRVNAAVARAKRTGKYALPIADRYKEDADKMVGKLLTLESVEGNTFEDVRIKKVEYIRDNVVMINGKHLVNIDENMTTDGMYMTTLGSEAKEGEATIKIAQVTGTVLQDIDDLLVKTLELDKGRLSEGHKEHLVNVLSIYATVLQQTGNDIDIDVELAKAIDDKVNTKGYATPESGKMKLILGNQINHTMTEILAHEMQHVLIHAAIKNDNKLATKIGELRNEFKEHLTKKYGKGNEWQVFKREGMSNDMAKAEFEYTIDNVSKEDMDEFLAAITTNEKLVAEIGGMWTKPKELFSRPKDVSTPLGKILDWIANTINMFYGSIVGTKNGRDVAMELLENAVRIAHRDERESSKSIYNKILDTIAKKDKQLAKYTKELNKEHKTFAEILKDKEPTAVEKIVDSIWRIRGLAKARSMVLQNGLFSSVTRDMSNKYVAQFYEMFRHSKAFIEKEVVALKNVTADRLEKEYGFGKIKVENRRAMKRVLMDTDAQVLGDAETILKYLKDEELVKEDIEKLKEGLSKDTIEAADELAGLLVTNVAKKRNGYVNATQIAMAYEIKAEDFDATVEAIDKLVSLRAIEMSSKENRDMTMEAIESNIDGVNRVLELIKEDKKQLLKRAYGNDKMYEVKGAKQEVFNDDKKHYIVNKKEMNELVKAGMAPLGKHEELSRILGEDRYIVVGDNVDTRYTEGMMSVVQLKNEGDSLKKLLVESGMKEEEAADVIDELSYEDGEIDGALIPERSGTGLIYDYKIRLAHSVKEQFMNMDDDIVKVVASTTSNLSHKQEAMLNNKAALIHMRKFYQEHKGDPRFKFIEISERSTGKFKEYWDLMPAYMKKDIDRSGQRLMIEESLLVDFFGYKDVSLANAPWIKDKVKRQLVVKKMESMITELVRRWKHVIVAFTPATIQGNMMSNMFIALSHMTDKNPLKYMARFKSTWESMNKYQELRKKVIQLEVDKKAGMKIDEGELQRIKNAMHRNPVHEIMEDGQYNAILEDINTEYFNNEGILEGKLNAAIKGLSGGKDRSKLKDLIDLLYIRKDSRIHDSVMKLTTYSDVINKVIILEDMKAENKGKLTQDMLNYVDGLHVNYGYLDNRYVKYANDLGFLTFTKYFFRIIPAMLKMAGQKGVSLLGMETVVKGLGIGETPMTQLYNPIDSVMHKMSLWGRPGSIAETILTPTIL